MIRIALLSDTHSYLGEDAIKHLNDVDEIWHAGDVGDIEIIETLEAITKVRAVYGNIDDNVVRADLEKDEIFEVEKCKVWITHIAGYPTRYNKYARTRLPEIKPDIMICGHSHILKVIYDKEYNHLHLNPGAIGIYGRHQVRTILKFEIQDGKPINMRIVELPREGN